MFKLLVLIVALFSILAIVISPIFRIKHLTVEGGGNCLSTEKINGAGIIGKNIIFLSHKKLEVTLLEKFPCLKKIYITKKIPSDLNLSAEVDMPQVKIAGRNLFITRSGLVTQEGTSTLPELFIPSQVELTAGETTRDSQVLSAVELTSLVEKTDFRLSAIRIIDGGNIAFYSPENLIALFSIEKPKNLQVDSLQQVVAQAKIDSVKISKIDLRFDKPVVVYK